MSPSKAASTGDEELIKHYGSVRMTITGSGSLNMELLSLDEVKTSTLLPLTMAAATNIQPSRLCNFVEQKAKLRLKTTLIDEHFLISKIIIFAKFKAAEYPQ